jgi:hypothetical protein
MWGDGVGQTNYQITKEQRWLPPLLGGEGWGEGERETQITGVLCSQIFVFIRVHSWFNLRRT